MAAMENITEADTNQINQLAEDLRRYNGTLQTETETFEWFITHLHPQEISENLDADSPMEMGKVDKPQVQRESRERLHKLTLEQKCDIAERVYEEMKKDLQQFQKSSKTMAFNHKTTTEEADIRLAELKKANFEFDRDVSKTLQKGNAMTNAAKITRYTEERIKAKDALIEKLHQKNASLSAQRHKLQLQHEQQMGEEKLHEVDVQQMKVVNSQYVDRLQQRNQDMMRLKMLAGNTLQVLNSYKKKIETATQKAELLSRDIASRQELLVKTEAEIQQAKEEREKAEIPNRKLKAQMSNFRAPAVLEYVTTQASHTQLEQSVRNWERKVEIAEMSLKMHAKAWNKVCTTAGAANDHGVSFKYGTNAEI